MLEGPPILRHVLLSQDMNPGMWQLLSILKIERVENGMQEDGSAEPYYKAMACDFEWPTPFLNPTVGLQAFCWRPSQW